jgi:hypothetical protein
VPDASGDVQLDLRVAVRDEELQIPETTPVKPTSARTTTEPSERAS